MKKILVFVVVYSTFLINVTAQDTSKVYAGFVGSAFIDTKNPKNVSTFANLRAGGFFEKKISKQTTLNAWATFDPGSNLILFQAVAKTKLSKDWGLQYGYGATPATLIRPFPLSVDGQFQFTAESMPPGGALGGFISYKETKFGLYKRDNSMEYHIAQNIGLVSIGLWATKKNSSGGTIQLNTKRVYLMATITNENKQALATAIQPLKNSDWKVVHDFGVSNGKITNNLIGILYPFEIKKFSAARFGFGYDFQTKSAGFFWLIGLDR